MDEQQLQTIKHLLVYIVLLLFYLVIAGNKVVYAQEVTSESEQYQSEISNIAERLALLEETSVWQYETLEQHTTQLDTYEQEQQTTNELLILQLAQVKLLLTFVIAIFGCWVIKGTWNAITSMF